MLSSRGRGTARAPGGGSGASAWPTSRTRRAGAVLSSRGRPIVCAPGGGSGASRARPTSRTRRRGRGCRAAAEQPSALPAAAVGW